MDLQQSSDLLAETKKTDKTNLTPEEWMKQELKRQVKEHQSPTLPKCGKLKKAGRPFFIKTLLFLIGVLAIVLVRRMDQMSFKPISEEKALEMAQEVKVTLPDQKIHLLNSNDTQALKTGTTVKVLGVYKNKLNKGNSPRVYWDNQNYLIELPDGTRGYGILMETAIGQKTILPEGDTAVITAVKKLKKAPTVQANGEESRFEYAYTLEGHKEQYALEDLKIYFPQRVTFLGKGLNKEKYTASSDTIAENMSFGKKVKKFFFYDIRPVTKKSGFFLFPKYQKWNEFYLQRWFRVLMVILAYILEFILIVTLLLRRHDIIDNYQEIRSFNKNYQKAQAGDTWACYKLGEACQKGFYGVYDSDFAQAMHWYKEAATKGNGDACAKLGEIYEDGHRSLIEQDLVEAYRWYEKGHISSKECDEGMKRIINRNLGTIYHSDGIKAKNEGNYEKAFKLFKQAAEYGYSPAQVDVGRCYFNGEGTAGNQVEAVNWFRKAALQKSADAQTMLGMCYMQGLGIKADQDEGIKYLIEAAKNGSKNAQNLLKSLNVSY